MVSSPYTGKSINLVAGSLTIHGILHGVLDTANLLGCKSLSVMHVKCLSKLIRYVSPWEACFRFEYGST